MNNYFQDLYLDWVNNYLTTTKMAADYGFSVEKMEHYINIGRKIHESTIRAKLVNPK